MILLDKTTTLQIFNPPPPDEFRRWLKDHQFSGQTVDPEDDYTGSYTLSSAIYWATTKHPDAETVDICSFAGLVQSYTSGFFGGFGTDDYKKERIIDNIILTLTGGTPAPPGEIVGLIPADLATGKRKPSPEDTEKIIGIMDHAYFGDLTDAITAILETVSPDRAAQIVLSMAQTNAEYKEMHKIAKNFLARKASIGELRQSVKKISEKIKFIKTSMMIELPVYVFNALRSIAREENRSIYRVAERMIEADVKQRGWKP